MTRTLRVRLGAGLFIGAAALSLAGCGSEIKPEGAAQSVVDLVSEKTDFKPNDVKCPDGVKAEVGTTFDCKFTGPDGDYVAGSETQKVLPPGPLFSSTSVPRCASAIHRAIGRPSPVPTPRRAASSCTNRSKILD